MAVEPGYREFVQWLIDTGDTRVFLNSDKEHAIEVLSTYFKNAKKSIRIYAGCLADPVGTDEKYIKDLCSAIRGGVSLRVLLTNYDENKTKDSALYKQLAYYQADGKDVGVRTTSKILTHKGNNGEARPVHFTVVDENAIRLEFDTEKRKAACRVNYPDGAKKLSRQFDELYDSAEDIELSSEETVSIPEIVTT